MPIRIAMVEDDAPFATTLQTCFARNREIEFLKVFATAEAALEKVPVLMPDVLLVDINLPKMSGIEFVQKISELCPSVICLMLTMYEESNLIFDALKTGACGYLLKRTPPGEVIEAIKEARDGGSPMTPQIARRVVSFFKNVPPAQPVAAQECDTLADRERQVLDLLAQGFMYKEIGESLQISTHTVNSYIRRIYEKLHVTSRSQAVAKYRGLMG